MTAERIRELEIIGFKWETAAASWNEQLDDRTAATNERERHAQKMTHIMSFIGWYSWFNHQPVQIQRNDTIHGHGENSRNEARRVRADIGWISAIGAIGTVAR